MKANMPDPYGVLGSTIKLKLGRAEYSAEEIADYLVTAQTLLSAKACTDGQMIEWQGEAGMALLALALVGLSHGIHVESTVSGETSHSQTIAAHEFDRALQQSRDMAAQDKALLFEEILSVVADDVPASVVEYLADLAPQSSVAVAAPLTDHYLICILACWWQEHIVCLTDTFVMTDRQQSKAAPVAYIRLLEQQQPQALVAEYSLLNSIMQHPAMDLADVSAIKQLLVVCPENLAEPAMVDELWPNKVACQFVFATASGWLSEAQRISIQQHEYDKLQSLLKSYPLADSNMIHVSATELEVSIRLQHSPEECEQRLDKARTLIAQVCPAVDARFPESEALKAVRLTYDINHIALLSMLNGLWHCGVFLNDDPLSEDRVSEDQIMTIAKVAPEHRVLIRRWLKVLVSEQMLEASNLGYRLAITHDAFSDQAMEQAFDDIAQAWYECMGSCETIDYARANAKALPDLIRGKIQAVHLLFKEGKTRFAKALYRENLISQYQHQQVANLAHHIASTATHKPVRILEIGAGTGATSETVLPALEGLEVDYHYTDVSSFFFEQASDLVKLNPSVSIGLYDIDKAPEAQSFPLYSFDIIIGGGVLNAARHTVSALQGLRRLLRPGGWLLITEPVLEEYWVMASQAFMLHQAEDDRSASEATFLSLSQWQSALEEAGFLRLAEQPNSEHPFYQSGHFVFAATAFPDYTPLPFSELQRRLNDVAQKRVALTVQL